MEKKSSFQFNGFTVSKSLIEIKDSSANHLNLKLNFQSSGLLNSTTNTFQLFLKVFVFDENKNINIEVDMNGVFIYQPDEHLENYMLQNAPALLFPYVRSYVTALTALSGISPITLPTMNLTGLFDDLKENIERI